MIDRITLQALARLSPRMVGYHLKRVARNKFCRIAPQTYAQHIERVSARVPALASTTLLPEQAQMVAAFYDRTYSPYIDSAAAGRFTYFAQEVDFGSPAGVDWHHTVGAEQDFHLWRQKFCHMGFICPMLMHGDDHHLSAVGDLLTRFRAQASFGTPGCFSSYWFPYSASHRILAILSGYLVARTRRSLPDALSCEIEEFLRWNIGFVLANIERELNNNHVERNLAALCFYYSNASPPPAALIRQMDRDVAAIIRDTILEDGLSVERSAMYQGLSVMALQVFAQTPFLSTKTRNLALARLKQAIRAWHFMTHPDGDIALFNDSWFGEVPSPGLIAACPDFSAVETLPDAGYGRICHGDIFALFDAGPIGPASNPGHGHADFLSVEVDIAGRRFIVDPGTYQYSTGPRRMHDRAAAQHNGPAVRGVEPVSYNGAFRVGRLAQASLVAPEDPAGDALAGELVLGAGLLRRDIKLVADGLSLSDMWLGHTAGAQTRLHIPDCWEILLHDERSVLFETEGVKVRIAVSKGRIASLEFGQWACHYLENRRAHVLDFEPIQGQDQHNYLCWTITRIF